MTPPNWLGTPNTQGQGQEVGPHGLEERRLGEFQARDVGNKTMDDGPRTADFGTNRQRRARARPSTPLLHPGNLMMSIFLLWGA